MNKKIKQALLDANLSQNDLAHVLNLDKSVISGWCTGRRNPTLKTLKRISAVTNKPLSFFLDEISKKTEEVDLKAMFVSLKSDIQELKAKQDLILRKLDK